MSTEAICETFREVERHQRKVTRFVLDSTVRFIEVEAVDGITIYSLNPEIAAYTSRQPRDEVVRPKIADRNVALKNSLRGA